MKNTMKKVIDNDKIDIFEFNSSKKDIINIILLENVKLRDIKTKKEYFNDTFLLITNRKGETRTLDLKAHIDITDIFNNFEVVFNKKSKKKPIFIEQ